MYFFKVANISKLLLMMKKEEGKLYRGKTIDEININVEDLASADEAEAEDEEINKPRSQITHRTSQGSIS